MLDEHGFEEPRREPSMPGSRHKATLTPAHEGSDWHELVEGEWLWREDCIDALLAHHESYGFGTLFVQGTTRNQTEFYPRFQHIVLLSAPAEVLIERLTTCSSTPYGKDPQELAETLGYVHTVEPLLRASATLAVVTTVPVDQVADIVLAHVC